MSEEPKGYELCVTALYARDGNEAELKKLCDRLHAVALEAKGNVLVMVELTQTSERELRRKAATLDATTVVEAATGKPVEFLGDDAALFEKAVQQARRLLGDGAKKPEDNDDLN